MANKNYREFELSTGKVVRAGKSAEQNDLLVEDAWPNDVLLHTLAPGSSFVNVGEKPMKKEIKEAAVFCALKSQFWRDNKKDVSIHVFLKKNTTKKKGDKAGLWRVGKFEKIVVKKSDVEKLGGLKS